MVFWNKLIGWKEIPEKNPEFPEIWHKIPEIPELLKWLGIAITTEQQKSSITNITKRSIAGIFSMDVGNSDLYLYLKQNMILS